MASAAQVLEYVGIHRNTLEYIGMHRKRYCQEYELFWHSSVISHSTGMLRNRSEYAGKHRNA